MLNLIKSIDNNQFVAILITLKDEGTNSYIANITPYVSEHYLIKTNKADILLGLDTHLKRILSELNPDIIHTTGVFPDYAVSKIAPDKQVITLHNYVYDDYPAKYGKVMGDILARIQLYAARKSALAVTCSESLSIIYKEKLNLIFEYIQNGIDLKEYSETTVEEKRKCRKNLSIPEEAFVFIYTGQFIKRKNVLFLLENFERQFCCNDDVFLILVGDGQERKKLQNTFKRKNILFHGAVDNVIDYLRAADVYISSSKSEGLPNGVLEAMATGLPVVLSDILPHRMLIEINGNCGLTFRQGDSKDLRDKLQVINNSDIAIASKAAYEVVHSFFDAERMSQQYQTAYNRIAEKN